MRENEALKLNEERLNQQVAEMQSRIDALESENSELKTKRANDRSLLISDIMLEIRLYQPMEQMSMFNMLRSLIAEQDGNWIEKIKENEERVMSSVSSTNETGTKRTLCLGVATDLILILLRKANIASYADNTKMAALISLVTDYSKDKIRQRLSETSPLAKRHQQEIETVNNVLESLGIEDRLKAKIR